MSGEVEESRDRWRARAKAAQNELSDLRSSLGLQGEWTPDDSISVYRFRANSAEAERDALASRLAEVLRLLDDPAARHLQPANWRDKVLAALASTPVRPVRDAGDEEGAT